MCNIFCNKEVIMPGRGKWHVYDKYGNYVYSFESMLQANHYARQIGGTVRTN